MAQEKNYEVNDVAGIVEQEGLGYAVQHYLSAERIQDAKLADLWGRAKGLLNEIETYLEEHADEEPEEDSDEDEDEG
jgi:hypothetical protein